MLIIILVFSLLYNSVNCWAQDPSAVDEVIAQSKELSQGHMEKLLAKMLQGLPADRQQQLVVRLDQEMDHFYGKERDRLLRFSIPNFAKKEEAISYIDIEEKKIINDLKELKEEIERLKKIPSVMGNGSIYRENNVKKQQEVQELMEAISVRSRKVAQTIHELTLIKKLSIVEDVKTLVNWYQSFLGLLMSMAVFIPPLLIGSLLPPDLEQEIGVLSVLASNLLVTIPLLILMINKLDAPPIKLLKTIANSSSYRRPLRQENIPCFILKSWI